MSDKDPKRSLVNGLAQLIVKLTKRPDQIHIEAVKEGWDGPEFDASEGLDYIHARGVATFCSCSAPS